MNMYNTQKILFIITSVVSLAVQLDAVSVNPSLCPTNKIAPHRREAHWEPSRPRTFGLIYSLLGPGPSRPRPPPLNDLDELQEKPQEDDPDDCGEIEDYDETDLSSITPGAHNKVNNREDRYLFGDNYIRPSLYPYGPNRPPKPPRPPRPPQRPPTPQRPQRPSYNKPTRPPYYSGGIFGSNFYRPPSQHYPSSHIKPVHENTYEEDPQAAYRPGLIGGTLAQIVGFPLVRPTESDETVTSANRPRFPFRFPDSDADKTRRPRAKPPNLATSVFGSFIDLLFK